MKVFKSLLLAFAIVCTFVALVGCHNKTTNTTAQNTTTESKATDALTTNSGDHTHSWSNWTSTKNATCTDKGLEERTCSECGQTETRETDALGHMLHSSC